MWRMALCPAPTGLLFAEANADLFAGTSIASASVVFLWLSDEQPLDTLHPRHTTGRERMLWVNAWRAGLAAIATGWLLRDVAGDLRLVDSVCVAVLIAATASDLVAYIIGGFARWSGRSS